jgi:hypothetical protein
VIDTLDLTDGAAGCLVLLYGQQRSRIATMTASQVTTRSGTTFVRFGHDDMPVPAALGTVGDWLNPSWAFPVAR